MAENLSRVRKIDRCSGTVWLGLRTILRTQSVTGIMLSEIGPLGLLQIAASAQVRELSEANRVRKIALTRYRSVAPRKAILRTLLTGGSEEKHNA